MVDANDDKDPRSRLSDAEWMALLWRYVRGERDTDLAAEAGVSVNTVRWQARNRAMRKLDHPDAVYRWRRVEAPPRRCEAVAAPQPGQAFDFDPEHPAAAVPGILARAGVAAGEGRLLDYLRLGQAARETKRLARMVAADREARDLDEDEGPPREPAVLHPGQTPPAGNGWSTWLFLGGRGAGKTFAGASWLDARAREAPGVRLAMLGPSLHDVREVMVEGPSGVRALAASRRERPRWEASRRRLVWANGSEAAALSAAEPERLRGPQHHHGWADEFCTWRKAGETLALLRMGLRLGERPRLVVTTTPKPTAGLRALIAEAGTERTDAATWANAAHLPPAFVADLQARYGGTRLSAQELDGLLLEAAEGALWRRAELSACHGARPPELERVVVAVDPPAGAADGGSGAGGSACGIVAAGVRDGRFYVLADRSARGLGPSGWARAAGEAARDFGAEAVLAEANQGGEMVRATLVNAGVRAAVRLRRAVVGKRARAEPVAALYEQGRVTHCPERPGALAALEEEMCGLGAEGVDGGTFDRVDALVWALSELGALARRGGGPRVVAFD